MGMSLSIFIVDPEKDEFEWIGRSSDTLNDLFYGPTGDTLNKHLSNDELQILVPTDWPEAGELLQKSRDARPLRAVLKRVSAILLANEEEFPRAHFLVGENPARPSQMIGAAHWRDESGRRWSLEAFHHSVEHREEVRVRVSNGEPESHWISADEVVQVEARSFRIHSESWCEWCRPDIDAAIAICDKAIQMSAPVLWTIG
jgi:hypothetical protein